MGKFEIHMNFDESFGRMFRLRISLSWTRYWPNAWHITSKWTGMLEYYYSTMKFLRILVLIASEYYFNSNNSSSCLIPVSRLVQAAHRLSSLISKQNKARATGTYLLLISNRSKQQAPWFSSFGEQYEMGMWKGNPFIGTCWQDCMYPCCLHACAVYRKWKEVDLI